MTTIIGRYYYHILFTIGKFDRLTACLLDRRYSGAVAAGQSIVSGRPRVVQHTCDRLTCGVGGDAGREGQGLQSCMRCKLNAKPHFWLVELNNEFVTNN